MKLLYRILIGVLVLSGLPVCDAQSNATDPLGALTLEQKTRFQAASAELGKDEFVDALVTLRALLDEVPPTSPAHSVLAKFTAETALNTGDRDEAVKLLLPLIASDPADWQAHSLLARYDTETGNATARDRELATLKTLHDAAPPDSKFAKLNQILLERDVLPADKGSMRVWYSLVPWGRFKTYVYARVYDVEGHQRLRVTLESGDFDQPYFAKEHPDLAAKGVRRFSMDGYGEDQKQPDGSVIQSHSTYAFFDGEPPYDIVRAKILAIASGQTSPMSRTDPTIAK